MTGRCLRGRLDGSQRESNTRGCAVNKRKYSVRRNGATVDEMMGWDVMHDVRELPASEEE